MRKILVTMAVLTLSGCSAATLSEPPAQTGDHNKWPGLEYKQWLADSDLVATLRKRPSYTLFEVSDLKRTEGAQRGDWMTCLRIGEDGKLIYYGAFFDGKNNIVEVRRSVMLDRCEQDQYSPLPNPTPSLKKEIGPNPT